MIRSDSVKYCSDFVNAFGETIQESDVQAAYEQIDKSGEKRVRLKRFKLICEELNLTNENDRYEQLFQQIDLNERGFFRFQDLQNFFEDPSLESYEFCERLLGGFMYDKSYSNFQNELALDDIKALINKLDAGWEDRVRALQSFTRQMLKQKKKTRFSTSITQFAQHLCLQLKDRRTIVSRAICITIAKICRKKKDWCSHVASRLLKSLLDCGVRGNVQIAADSAAQCCLAIVKNVPDNRKGDLTATIIDGCQDRGYSNVRICSFVLLSQLMQQAIDSNTCPVKKQKVNEWWDEVIEVIQRGIKDSDKNVRSNAYRCLLQLELFRPRQGKAIVNKFKRVQMNTYDKIRNSDAKFQLTRVIFLTVFEIPNSNPKSQKNTVLRTKTMPLVSERKAGHISSHRSPTYHSSTRREANAFEDDVDYDSSEEKAEDPEEEVKPMKKTLGNLKNRQGSALTVEDSHSQLWVHTSSSLKMKRLPSESLSNRSYSDWSASSPIDRLSSKRDIGSPTMRGHFRQSTKELMKQELEKLKAELALSKRQIDSLQVKREQMEKNEKRIEVLQQEFVKMLHVTENMDRKHVEMVAEMQRKHEEQFRQMEMQRRQEQREIEMQRRQEQLENEQRMQESIQAIVQAVSASPSVHNARVELSTIHGPSDSIGHGMRSHSRDRKYSSDLDLSYGSFTSSQPMENDPWLSASSLNTPQRPKRSHKPSNGGDMLPPIMRPHKLSHGGDSIPPSPRAGAPIIIRTMSGREGTLMMEASDAGEKVGIVQFDEVREEDSEIRRRKSYRKIANPKGGLRIDRAKQRDANISFDFVGEAMGPLMKADSDYFDSADFNPHRLTPRSVKFREDHYMNHEKAQRSFFYNPVE